MSNASIDVTRFLDGLDHPLRTEIELLRTLILGSVDGLQESVKWNGPNYSFDELDRLTMKIQPPKNIQLIFHRGAKKASQPKTRLIQDESGILEWKENERAVATLKSFAEIQGSKPALTKIIRDWMAAARV